MRSPESHMQRWLDPLVFAIWTLFLIYLLVSQRYIAFLRPEFGVLLSLAHFIAMAFMLTAMSRAKRSERDISAVLRSLVLLVPVLYALIMPDSMLGRQAFQKRFTGTSPGSIGLGEGSVNTSKDSLSRPGGLSSGQSSDALQPDEPVALTILQLMLNPNMFNGQRVVVTGMILRDAALSSHFGGLDTALYRFMLSCCAADARPLAIALEADPARTFAQDQWVQVEGIFKLQETDGRTYPVVSKPQIRLVDPPSMPYLF